MRLLCTGRILLGRVGLQVMLQVLTSLDQILNVRVQIAVVSAHLAKEAYAAHGCTYVVLHEKLKLVKSVYVGVALQMLADRAVIGVELAL